MGQQILQSRMNRVATKLINKFAGPLGTASITVKTPATYDAGNGNQDAATETTTTLDVSPPVPVTERHVRDNTAVLSGDMIVYVAESEFSFERSQIGNLFLTYDGIVYKMVWFKQLYAGEDPAATEVFVRNV